MTSPQMEVVDGVPYHVRNLRHRHRDGDKDGDRMQVTDRRMMCRRCLSECSQRKLPK